MPNRKLLQKVADAGANNPSVPSLGRVDWLEAAIEQFTKKGINAVLITRLAEQLKVTRGRFYWHFENRSDLLEALVSFWSQKNAQAVSSAAQVAPAHG